MSTSGVMMLALFTAISSPAVGVDSHLDHRGGVVGTWQTISPTRSDASDYTASR